MLTDRGLWTDGRSAPGGASATSSHDGRRLTDLTLCWHREVQLFRLNGATETPGIDRCEVAPHPCRHIHDRLAVRDVPRGNSPPQHRAWLHRIALLP